MSFIVKGVDLPKDKAIAIHYANRYGEMETILVSESDIIQIPKDHGRMIDADALETVFKDMANCEWNQQVHPISWAYAFEDTIDEIDNAPTILEAEE